MDGQGDLSIDTANGVDAGVLSPANWNAFNNKVSGVSAGTGISLGGTATQPQLSVVYGTTSTSAAAGNDPRLSDSRAPLSGSGFYIQASPASPQAASLSIAGDAAIEGNVTIGGTLSGGGIPQLDSSSVDFSGAVSAGSLSSNSTVSGASLSATGAVTAGSAQISGTIAAGGFSGNGAQLTNLSATALTGKVSAQNLPADVCLDDGNNAFTGSNTFSGTQSFNNLSASGTVTGGAFSGDGTNLYNLGSASVGSVGGQTLGQALSSASNGNATQIKGVPVDDSAKADGYFLGYTASTGTIQYKLVNYGGPPAPAVPTSVSWASGVNSTGNVQCAIVKGVCTGASSSGGSSILCSTVSSGGSAACTGSSLINASASWTQTSTGDYACTGGKATCVQAYDGSGNAVACNAQNSAGAASCYQLSNSQAWSDFIDWDNGIAFSADAECTLKSLKCYQAFNSSGGPQACGDLLLAGRARCTAPTAADGWNFGISWAPTGNTATTADIECAKRGGVGVTEWCTIDGTQYSADTTFGTCGGIAQCRNLMSSDLWTAVDTWFPTGNTGTNGEIQCAKDLGMECVNQFCTNSSGGSVDYSCTTEFGSCAGLALCRPVNASDQWTNTTQWAPTVNYSTSGEIQCATALLEECVNVYVTNSDGSAYPCSWPFNSGAGIAKCRPLTPADQWTALAQWGPTNSYSTSGEIECGKKDLECVTVYTTNADATIYPCSWPFNSASGLAKCRAPTAADLWDSHVTWAPNSSTSGDVECAKINKACDTTYVTNTDATNYPCSSLYSSSGLAKCRALTGSDPWSNHAQWTNQNSSGVAACSALGLSCYAVYSTADGSAQTCSASFGAGGGGLALCE